MGLLEFLEGKEKVGRSEDKQTCKTRDSCEGFSFLFFLKIFYLFGCSGS